ncbi:MAG: UDP-2,3-diacylglucosamine diphosphatase LpxI [Proteobacteria bacterium]|nr:UDP-2,3-diacylglucosamine diphosphatase LpxI [Pseudomonadota bacterium]MBU1688871.1 UDP-2,3-diacylglucosamine diphosphatase LpxI [Pseudomonadota bacterium]
MSKIGIVAGGGQFPLLFAQAAKEKGCQVVVAAHRGETRPELEGAADRFCWVKLGQLGRIIKFFKDEAVTEAVLLGTITKTRIFKDILPDLKGLSLWNQIKIRQDDTILRAVAGALEEEGIRILESTCYLSHLLFPQGVLTRRSPSSGQKEDINFGWKMARAIGELDIGQCVVVRDRTVLAVEAIEGTDATILRGGGLGRKDAVVVKVKKPGQDFRFDLPAIGAGTISSMKQVGASLLAVEAGQALLFDRDEVIAAANSAGIVVVGVEESRAGELHYR